VYTVDKGAFDKQLWCSGVRLQDVWTLESSNCLSVCTYSMV